MTIQEFDNQKWTKGMKCFYMNKEYTIFGVDFESRNICISRDGETLFKWFNYVYITLINK
jgi:hypothetical protein